MAIYRMPVTDHSNERSTVRWNIADAATDPQITALRDAIAGITLGTLGDVTFVDETAKDAGSNAPSGNAFAQREMKWLVSYTDNVTNQVYKVEIPTADLGELVANTDLLDTVAAAGAAFVAAFEAIFLSPDGNAVTFVSARFVGRNL